MQRIALAAAAFMLGIGSSLAQTPGPTNPQPPASQGPGNKAINQKDAVNPGAPVAGANSFTESQAKSRLENHGFVNVTNLRKDNSGVWRATATKDGKQQNVSLDFQGSIVAQ